MPILGTEGELVPDVDALGATGAVDVLTFTTGPGDVVVHHARTLHAAGGGRRPVLHHPAAGDLRAVLRR
jgi:hypothetical protein